LLPRVEFDMVSKKPKSPPLVGLLSESKGVGLGVSEFGKDSAT
jgi:hypothetical protein